MRVGLTIEAFVENVPTWYSTARVDSFIFTWICFVVRFKEIRGKTSEKIHQIRGIESYQHQEEIPFSVQHPDISTTKHFSILWKTIAFQHRLAGAEGKRNERESCVESYYAWDLSTPAWDPSQQQIVFKSLGEWVENSPSRTEQPLLLSVQITPLVLLKSRHFTYVQIRLTTSPLLKPTVYHKFSRS